MAQQFEFLNVAFVLIEKFSSTISSLIASHRQHYYQTSKMTLLHGCLLSSTFVREMLLLCRLAFLVALAVGATEYCH